MAKFIIMLLLMLLIISDICYCAPNPNDEKQEITEKVTENIIRIHSNPRKISNPGSSSVIKILPANTKPKSRKELQHKLPDDAIYKYSFTWEDKEHARSGDGFTSIPSWFYSFVETDKGYSYRIMKDATLLKPKIITVQQQEQQKEPLQSHSDIHV